MKHYGDITKLNGHELPVVDIITGGSPCQDLSVAGKREGLSGERSGLFMEQIRIIKEMHNGCRKAGVDIRPRFMVWENVPGAFSSNKGEDFRAVLEETAKIADETAVIPRLAEKQKWSKSGAIMGDGWSIAWRVHDAQFWGVPQRRKRIALVADFRGGAAPEILFERKSVSGDSEPSREEGQGTATDAKRSINPSSYTLKIRGGREIDSAGKKAGKGALVQTELSATLGVSQDQTLITTKEPILLESNQNHATVQTDGVSTSLPASMGMGGGYVPMITDMCYGIDQQGGKGGAAYTENIAPTMASDSHGTPHGVVYGISSYDSNAMKSPNPHSGVYEADTSRTLDNNGGNPACNQGGMAVVQSAGFDGYNQSVDIEVAQPLRAADGGDSTPKVLCVENHPADSRAKIREGGMAVVVDMGAGKSQCGITADLSPTLATTHGGEPVICFEGNGSRPSHLGDGYKESEKMYTLNSTEHHGVCYGIDQQGGKGQANYTEGISPTILSDSHGTPHAVAYNGSNITSPINKTNPKFGDPCHTLTDDSRNYVVYDWHRCDTRMTELGETCNTMSASWGAGGNNMPYVLESKPSGFNGWQSTTSSMPIIDNGTPPIEATMPPYVCESSDGDIAGTLDANYFKGCGERQGVERTVVAITPKIDEKGKGFSLRSRDYKDPQCVTYANEAYDKWSKSVVRRLTPMECERLQGFPDGWTDIGDWIDSKGKKHKGEADSPRYKALGNSIALPFWQWMAERMCKYLDNPTMGSLFSGIGGFELVFSRCGCKPIWASEIEEFPIAVTKLRFGEEK